MTGARTAEARLVDSLAQRLYSTHQEWRADLSEAGQVWPLWFALREDLREPYMTAAKAMIEGEDA